MRGRSDWVIAKHLRDALSLSKERRFEEALQMIEKAKILSPDFYECYRVDAWINALMGNASQAYDSYERAIETEPKAANAHMMFAGFLLRDLHDAQRASEELEKVTQLLPDNPEPKLEFARCCLYLARFDDAEEILDQLAGMAVDHERVQTKIVDLQIQVWCRKADFLASNQEPLKALEALESLRDYFERIVEPDKKMYSRLDRLRRSAAMVRNQLPPGSESYRAAGACVDWINSTCDAFHARNERGNESGELELWERGYLARYHSSGKFGFIKSHDNDEYFFHVSSVADESLLEERSIGVGVRFRVSLDYMNRLVAIDVHRADPLLRPGCESN